MKKKIKNTKLAQNNSKKPKLNYWLVPLLVLVIILAFSSTLLKNKNLNKPESNSLKQSENFPIRVLNSSLNKDTIASKGAPAPCQPIIFDPKVNKFTKVKQNGTPSELYKIQGFQDGSTGVVMMIDGWYKEGENKVVLPAPYNVTIYNFGCASSSSSLIDLTKNGNRQALYTHVLNFAFSIDGKKLFLVNNTNNNGTWSLHKRIINIETNQTSEIPNLKCTSGLDGFWQGNRLLTYAENKNKPDYQTDVCIWDASAKLISRVETTTAWGAANKDFLAEKIGLLPTEPDVFYAYTSKDDNTCSLFLVNTLNKNTKSIEILDKRNYPQSYYCSSPRVEFDFSNMAYDDGILRYRVEKYSQVPGQTVWDTWQTQSNK